MRINQDTLRRDTVVLITEIDKQIEEAKSAMRASTSTTLTRNFSADSTYATLLGAKATAYNTLVLLQTKR